MKKEKLVIILSDIIDVMIKKNLLAAYLQEENLNPNSTKKQILKHLLKQVEALEEINRNILLNHLEQNALFLRIILGEIPQSLTRSIFFGDLQVSRKNSFINVHHVRKMNSQYDDNQTIPDFLARNHNTLIFDLYLIPIPTSILKKIRVALRNGGILDEIMDYQAASLNELLKLKNPQNVHLISRYKCILPECTQLIRRLKNEHNSFSLEFNPSLALSGGGGYLNQLNFQNFLEKENKCNEN